MSQAPHPTLKTIAQLTGLAVPTVSRALSCAQDIGLATRTRVRKVADEIGYRAVQFGELGHFQKMTIFASGLPSG